MFGDLNQQQADAVAHTGSPLLIVAGAGTGKTKTLVSRVLRIIEDGADPSRILLLTFTRRSASEMIGRVSASSNDRAASQVWGGTFHAISNRILRHYGKTAGLKDGFTVLDQSDTADMFGIVRNEEGFGERGKRFPRKETIAGIYSRMVNSQAKLPDVLEADYPWCAEHLDDLKTIFTAYTRRKREQQVLDFDDLLLFWRGLTVSTAGDTLRGLFDHILIDEYQDTNPIQASIIQGMCRPDTDLCAVGDDAQAIYGFRSATVANMWEFGEQFPGATVVTLEQNYRSTMPILQAANAALAQSPAGDDGPRHYDKTLWSERTTGPLPRLITTADEGDQSSYVAESILDARERGVDLREQAVLVRAGHHSDGLELELTRRDIPYVKYGGLKYLEAAHIKDLLSLLRVLDNPVDQLAWHRVLSSMDGVGPATVRRLIDELGIDDTGTADAGDDPVTRFVNGIAKFPGAAKPQAELLRAAFEDIGSHDIPPAEQIDRLRSFCAAVFPSKYENFAARLADIEQLAASANAYLSRSRFLTEVTLDPPERTGDHAGPPHLDDDWLTVSTIHSAKGMEWKHVYLLHAADGNIPSDMAIGDKDGLAEELRLLYVAMTRAKDELTISVPLRFHVNRRANDDRHLYAQMSRFIEPIKDLFEQGTAGMNEENDPPAMIDGVGIADEVDTMLHSLWE